MPEIFTQNIRNAIQTDQKNLSARDKDRSLKSIYLTEANYQIEHIVKSGNALINDEITGYLNRLADILLANNTALRNQLHIYTLKSSLVNAYSYDKGYVFIDVGLIAQAESEAQLAYILTHEIAHYIKQHNINEYVVEKKIDGYNYLGEEEGLLKKCQYSKEQESEADLEGFKLYEQTRYDLTEAEKSFDMLQYSHLPFELVEFKKSFLETKKFIIPDAYVLKEVSSIRNSGNEDDTKHTHPNTLKRKKTISAVVAAGNNSGRPACLTSVREFEYARDRARFELLRLYLLNRDYPNALYASYILSQKYPDNQFLAEVITKTLYGLTLYKKGLLGYTRDSYLDEGIKSYKDIESYPQQVYYLIEKMPENEWTMMAMNYAYRAHKKFPLNAAIMKCTDELFGLMAKTYWGITDFMRLVKKDSAEVQVAAKTKTGQIATIQQENNVKNTDTAYYKEAFLDLFASDKEFREKFPLAGSAESSVFTGFTDYRTKSGSYHHVRHSRKAKGIYIQADSTITKAILLEPFYRKIDDSGRESELLYVESDKAQEKYARLVIDLAQKQKFGLVLLDPGTISAGDVDKLNDYSLINDWFSERFDGRDGDKNMVLSTDEIENVMAKYGTHYVLRTGIINYRINWRKKRTYFYSFIYDLKTGEQVYKKYEGFSGADHMDLLNAKVYQVFYELKMKHGH
ncbi:MAG: M48 family metallopeptidase [Bacteroidia bacterium]